MEPINVRDLFNLSMSAFWKIEKCFIFHFMNILGRDLSNLKMLLMISGKIQSDNIKYDIYQ